jgi:hypothetical protein
MCWFKSKSFAAIALLYVIPAVLTGCRSDGKGSGNGMKYFDISGYFKAETARLENANRPVSKTITHNGVTETKKVSIENWEQELDSFTGGDINKPAWKNSYTTSTGDGITLYKAKEPDLKVREIIVKKDADKIKWIVIYTKTENILYKNIEKLSYYPDSLYQIEKSQHVKLMGNNNYKITGVIVK